MKLQSVVDKLQACHTPVPLRSPAPTARDIEKVLDKFAASHKVNAIIHSMPCNPEAFLKLTFAQDDLEREQMDKLPYMQLIGSLLYVSCMTRPDMYYHMSILCKFMQDPCTLDTLVVSACTTMDLLHHLLVSRTKTLANGALR